MKKLFIAATLLFSGTYLVAADGDNEVKVDSKVDKVTVFLSGAQVYRNGSFLIQAGVSQIIMENVSPYMDQNTLQAKGTGDFTIMDVKFEQHYPQPTTQQANQNEMPADIRRKMRMLKDSIEVTSYDLEEIRAVKEVYTMERNMLLNNGTVKGTGKVNDSIPLLKDAMTFFHEKMTYINMELFKIKKKEDRMNKKITGMQGRLKDLENWKQHNNLVDKTKSGPIYRVVVTVNADKAVRGKVEVAYIVSQAGWKPSYDLRAKSMNAPIELNYKAEVYQNTGVDWAKIPLTLSTANPYSRQQKPELSTWYISYYDPQYYRNKKTDYAKGRAEGYKNEEAEVLAKPSMGASDDFDGDVGGMQRSMNVRARDAVDYTSAVENMISAEYNINLPYSIKSNNEPHMVAVTKKSLKADYNLALVPKMDRNAFLIANVTEWDDLNLVPAKARIYYDGTFVGQSYIDPIAMEDTLRLAMGRDNSVSAVRKKMKDKTKEKVIGDNKVRETYYEITLKNQHGYQVNLIIEDQVPVSNNTDIKVDVLEKGKSDMNEYTGILKWKVKLRAGGSEKLNFGYSVKYDKNKNLSMAF